MLFVRTIETDSLNLYALGVFYNRSDAVTYLGYLKGLGLEDAYIINQYDLDNLPRISRKHKHEGSVHYTPGVHNPAKGNKESDRCQEDIPRL